MSLNQVTLPVLDLTIATDFYRRMGFLQITNGAQYARFECLEGNMIKLFWAGENRHNPPWRVERSES